MSGYEKFSGSNQASAPPPPYGSQSNFVPMQAQPMAQTHIQMPSVISHVQVRREPARECCCCCCTCPFWVCGLFFLVLFGLPLILSLY